MTASLATMACGEGPMLVIGATGQQGGAAARALLSRGWAVRALVRNPGKPAARQLRDAGAVLGLPATILRPASFMDNFATYNRPMVQDGELAISLALRPQTPVALVATRDIAEFAAIAFGQPGRFTGRQLELAGDYLTGPQIAAVFTRACGMPARFRQVPIEQLRAFDENLARQYQWMDHRGAEAPDLTALRAEHPGLMTLAAWLEATGWKPGP